MLKAILLFAVSICASAVTNAQQTDTSGPPPTADLQRAAQAFAQRSWPEARAAYAALARRYPSHALSRFRLGVAQLELGELAEAEHNLRDGERLGMPAGQAAYRLAQLFALRQNVDSAFAELNRAAANALIVPPQALEADTHLASLHGQPSWKATRDAF